MRKLLERLRCWLITRLGGYTEQTKIPPILREQHPIIQQTSLDVHTIHVEAVMHQRELTKKAPMEAVVKGRLVEMLVEELDNAKLISWQQNMEAGRREEVKVSATLCVVRRPK